MGTILIDVNPKIMVPPAARSMPAVPVGHHQIVDDYLRGVIRIGAEEPSAVIAAVHIKISFIVGYIIIVVSVNIFIMIDDSDDTFSVPTGFICRFYVYTLDHFSMIFRVGAVADIPFVYQHDAAVRPV